MMPPSPLSYVSRSTSAVYDLFDDTSFSIQKQANYEQSMYFFGYIHSVSLVLHVVFLTTSLQNYLEEVECLLIILGL